MSEWWTYTLSDFLLFSPQTYYRLFEIYNLAIWPFQILSLVLGASVLVLLYRGGDEGGRLLGAILAALWLWVAGAFLWQRYAAINWMAVYFAAAFAIQALILIYLGVIRRHFVARPARSAAERVGLGVFLSALVLYPFIAPLLGRPWTQAEIFGVAPDPTVMATLGVALLSASPRPPWLLLGIPILWCLVSGATLWAMNSPEALALPATALLVLALSVWKRLRQPG